MTPSKRAIIFVDIQADFCDGSLAVPGAKAQLPLLQLLLDHVDEPHYSIAVLTGDLHPANHSSFMAQGGPWPPHCVQGTQGAEKLLDVTKSKLPCYFLNKGMEKEGDAYSAFEGEVGYLFTTNLEEMLRDMGIQEVDVCGWALDFCVKATALDAARRGFKTRVLIDYCSAVGPSQPAIDEIVAAGVLIEKE